MLASHTQPKIVAPVSRPAVLGASRPSETSPDLEFWAVAPSARDSGQGPGETLLNQPSGPLMARVVPSTPPEIDIYGSGSESSSDSLLVAAADLELETFVFLISDRNEVLTRCKLVPRL